MKRSIKLKNAKIIQRLVCPTGQLNTHYSRLKATAKKFYSQAKFQLQIEDVKQKCYSENIPGTLEQLNISVRQRR